MPVLLDHEPFERAAGSYVEGPVTLPNGTTNIIMRLARKTTATPTLWADGVFVSMQSEIALNGTGDFRPGGGFKSPGGIIVGRLGELTESLVNFPIPAATQVRLRLPVTISGGTLETLLTIETVP